MEDRRVVVTGIGLITPLGNNTEDSWQALREGKNGIRPWSMPDFDGVDVHVAAEVRNFNPEDYLSRKEVRRMDRVMHFSVVSSQEAMREAGLNEDNFDHDRMGVICATGIGGIASIEEQVKRGYCQGFNRISPFFVPLAITNIVASQISMYHKLHGPCYTLNTACAAGTDAVGHAYRLIKSGTMDLMLAGGAEAALTKMGVGGFAALRALSKSKDPNRASIPFDKERDGFVMGEGAGMLVLEEREHALKRGANIIAEVVGYAATADAYHLTAMDPEAKQSTRCFKLSLEDAGIEPKDVDYINAHGTSTKLNDGTETLAIHQAFGEHAKDLAISSTKSMIGHLLGGSGGVEAAITVLALRDGFVPPTINYKVPDPECDLDYVPNVGRKADLHYAMSNSLGFGGHNACLTFARADERA